MSVSNGFSPPPKIPKKDFFSEKRNPGQDISGENKIIAPWFPDFPVSRGGLADCVPDCLAQP